jgi:hypothetical protein
MPDCQNCEIYKNFSGHTAKLDEISKFKDKMTAPGTGTIDRLWTAIEQRASRGLLIFFTLSILSVMTVLFGLVYRSNEKIVDEFSKIRTDIGIILKDEKKRAQSGER